MSDEDGLFTEEEIDQLILDFENYNIFPENIGIDHENELQCECGAEKCGSPKHSDWCPKWQKD